jgi:hypothetical protein
MNKRPNLLRDERGNVVVIAVFMSACLVGCLWYMFGLGEAMIYRQQLRAAADATAFGSAVLDAVGMNIVSMLNIAMAVALSVLLLLQIIFLVGVVLTLFALLLEIPTFGGDSPISAGLIEFDSDMYDAISEVQEPVFMTIAAINIAAGTEGMLMPWAALAYGNEQPALYKSAAPGAGFQPFSLALFPTRIPLLFDVGEGFLGNWLTNKLPTLKSLKKDANISINPFKADASVSRYGLPFTDDKYSVLCEHAAHELVQEFEDLTPLGWIAQALHLGPILDGFGWVFGTFIGAFPGIFCSGVDPQQAMQSELGVDLSDAKNVSEALGEVPFLKWLVKPIQGFIEVTQKGASRVGGPDKDKDGKAVKGQLYRYSMFPMKPFDLYKNGNSFGQVWATIRGNEASTTGAITGVDVASWGTPAAPAAGDVGETMDFSEAEFYYDCGPGSPSPVMGDFFFPDSSGSWDECKFNAMWNMYWKARLVRWQPAELPVLKAVLLAAWSGSGIESILQSFASKVPFVDGQSVIVKYGITDILKNCYINAFQGKKGSIGPSTCPFSTGGASGAGDVEINGTAPDGTSIDGVYH